MRRILTILAASVIAFACLPIHAFAHASAAEYLRVGGDNVSLYADKLVPAALFTIPKTFYVKVISLSYTPDYHVVEYNGVRGLVKASDVGSDTVSDVANPYYTAQTVTAHVNTCLYTAPSFTAETAISASGLSLTYLGKVNGDKGSYDTAVWFAVLYANEMYYLHCSLTNNLSLLESTFAPIHPNSVVETSVPESEEGTPSESEERSGGVDILRILLIVGMIVPLVVILFLLFKPRKRHAATRKRGRPYRDEDDYDDYYGG